MRSVVRSPTSAVARSFSAFANVPMGPADPILGLSIEYQNDKNPNKVNLGAGVYRGDDGKPCILECVKEAQRRLLDRDHEYAAISGVPGFVKCAQNLAFGADSPLIAEGRLASSQTLSGTGALRVAGNFLERWYTHTKVIKLPDPTWGNHIPVFKDAGLDVQKYTYYNPATKGLDFAGMLASLDATAEGTIVLLHACAHNPTGVDPSQDEWRQIIEVVKRRNLFPLVDMAYQGFASGDPERDAFALREIARNVPNFVLCQSFAKSFGLYGQRCGAVHFVLEDKATADKVLSQLKILIRPMYSNPPLHGARIVETIMTDDALSAQWTGELKAMADRMNGVRTSLVDELTKAGSPHDWKHITNQIGMMAYTGLSKEQVARLKSEFSIYMTGDGRAAVTGLTTSNVAYVAKAFHEVSK